MCRRAPHFRPPTSDFRPRKAFTLIEMLVALAITLIMMYSVVRIFALVGTGVTNSRAIVEQAQQITAARNRLQADLSSVTATMIPPMRPERDEGYFEIIEGPASERKRFDVAPGGMDIVQNGPDTVMGDYDDYIMFTVRSLGEPFTGRIVPSPRHPDGTIRSHVAEVIWFIRQSLKTPGLPATDVRNLRRVETTDPNRPIQLFALYRRVLLVLPDEPAIDMQGALQKPDPLGAFFAANDISAHFVVGPNGQRVMVPNSLGDLVRRENRHAHGMPLLSGVPTFPYRVCMIPPEPPANQSVRSVVKVLEPFDLPSGRLGEDVMLTNVLAFDVRVFDPLAPLKQVSAGDPTLLVPSDIGYNQPATQRSSLSGAYVDLRYSRYALGGPLTFFSSTPQQKSGLDLTSSLADLAYHTYDTWSWHYEYNAAYNEQASSEDNDVPANAATNGLDDNGNGIVDDPGERETSPPYPYPLRGIQVKIRTYEPDSRQIREVTVVQDFLPE